MDTYGRIWLVGEDEGDDVGPLLGLDDGLLEGEPVVTGFGVGLLLGEEVGVAVIGPEVGLAVIGPVEGDVCHEERIALTYQKMYE